jgi:hypothetical protein
VPVTGVGEFGRTEQGEPADDEFSARRVLCRGDTGRDRCAVRLWRDSTSRGYSRSPDPFPGAAADGGPSADWPLAQATVAFGDGSSQTVTASCAGSGSPTLAASHAYQAGGTFVVRVTAARFCNPAAQPEVGPGISEAGYPLVLPSGAVPVSYPVTRT